MSTSTVTCGACKGKKIKKEQCPNGFHSSSIRLILQKKENLAN